MLAAAGRAVGEASLLGLDQSRRPNKGSFDSFVWLSTFTLWTLLFLLSGSVARIWLCCGSCLLSSPCCFAAVGVLVVFSRLCMHFSSVSLFLVFCAPVLVKSVWPHRVCVYNYFILNEKRAQSRSRKKTQRRRSLAGPAPRRANGPGRRRNPVRV
jgi:hypothetical protein